MMSNDQSKNGSAALTPNMYCRQGNKALYSQDESDFLFIGDAEYGGRVICKCGTIVNVNNFGDIKDESSCKYAGTK